jgi:hypothetical protein
MRFAYSITALLILIAEVIAPGKGAYAITSVVSVAFSACLGHVTQAIAVATTTDHNVLSAYVVVVA